MNFPPFLRLQKMGVEPTRYYYHTCLLYTSFSDEGENEINSPVLLHQGNDTGHDDGDHRDVVHSHNARAHMGEHFPQGKGSGGHANHQ